MSSSAKILLAFGIYVLILGIIILIIPNVFLAVFGLPLTTEVWIRVCGMLLFLISFYYILAAKNELYCFFKWTVYARIGVSIYHICITGICKTDCDSLWSS